MFTGIIPALLTPLSAQGEVDTAALSELVEFLLSRGVDGFYVCGSTGEGLLLTEEERGLVVASVVRQVRSRVPVIAHVGAPATAVAERLAARARESGADAVASVPPFFYAVGQAAIEMHYRRIAAAAGLPLYLYNIPNATQVSLDAGLVCELVGQGVARGLKFTSYDLLSFREILERCGPSVNALAGPDEMLLPFLVMGAHGGIGTTYNLMPELFLDLYAAWLDRDLERAQELQFRIDRVILALRPFGVVPAVKAAMRFKGIDCGRPRAPLPTLTPEQSDQLRHELERAGLTGLDARA